MPLQQIKSRFDDRVLYECEADSLLEACTAVLDGLQRATVRTSDGSHDRCIAESVALELQEILLKVVAKAEGNGS